MNNEMDDPTLNYFVITFDVRRRRTHFHKCVVAFMYQRGISWPDWLKKHDTFWRPSHRTFGFYDSFETAENLVLYHSKHISEGETNEYALIEQVPMNMIYPSMSKDFKEMQWYRLNFDTELYEKCERPELDVDGWARTVKFCF